MLKVKLFFSTVILLTVFQVYQVNADNLKTQVVEPKWYEQPGITFPILVFFVGAGIKVLNDNLVFKQEKVVSSAIKNLKEELTKDRDLFFEKVIKLESRTDEKLNRLLENQNSFSERFKTNSEELKEIETKIGDIKENVNALENRVENMSGFLSRENPTFSTGKRL